MSWPREHEGKVKCYDFPDKYFPYIKDAIDKRMIVWGENSIFIGQCNAQFDYAGCTWELVEINECVTSIRLVKGKPTAEGFTFAVLKGKIKVS